MAQIKERTQPPLVIVDSAAITRAGGFRRVLEITVETGDTLDTIAAQVGVSREQLELANTLSFLGCTVPCYNTPLEPGSRLYYSRSLGSGHTSTTS